MTKTRKIVFISLLVVLSFFMGMVFEYGIFRAIRFSFLQRKMVPLNVTCKNLKCNRDSINEFYDLYGKYPSNFKEIGEGGIGQSFTLFSPLGALLSALNQ